MENEETLIAQVEEIVQKVNLKLKDRKIELLVISEEEQREGWEDYLATQYEEAGLRNVL